MGAPSATPLTSALPELELWEPRLAEFEALRRFVKLQPICQKNNLIAYNSTMEKGVPHCKLEVVKSLLAAGKIRTTLSARQGAL